LTLGGPTLARRFTGAGRDAVQFVQGVGPVTIAQAEPPSTPAETKSESESPTNGKTTQVNPKRENPVVESKLEGLKENLKALKNRQVLIEQHLEQMSKEAEEAQNKFEQLMNQYADSRREWIRLRIERDSIEAQIARLSDGQAVVRDNEPRSTEVAKRSPIAIQIPTAETVKQKADPGQGLPAMKRLGDVLFVVSPTGDKVSAASLDGTKLKSVRLSEPGDPPQEVSLAFIGSEDLPKGSNPSPYVTLRQRGGKVHRLAIFLLKEWVWRTFELPEPVTNAGAIVTPDLVFFQLDNGAVAAYSLLANRWDLLKFATPHDEGLTYSTEGNISIVTRPGHIYRYDSRIGRWSDLDTKALLNQPDRDAAASLDEQSTQSGPR